MFDHFVWSVLVVPMMFLSATHLLADRLRPDLAVRVFAWSTVATGSAAAITLVSFALKAFAELPVIARFGGWSNQAVLADTARVPWVSWVSLSWCVLGAGAVLIIGRRRRRALRQAARFGASLPGSTEVVLVPDESVEAFALPGGRGRIVVTTGMRDILDADRFAAVVAHERCHLSQGHHRLLWLTRLGAAMHPLLAPMVRRVEFLAERAADEAAAAELGDRRQLATALGLAALNASSLSASSRPLRPMGTLHVGPRPGQLPRRVLALLGDSVKLRYPVLVPAVIMVSSVVWTGECVYDLGELMYAAVRAI